MLPTKNSKERGFHAAFPEPRRPGLFTADSEHLHHRLLALGLTHRTVVILLYGVCLTFGLLAFRLCYRRINIILILAGAAAARGARIPRLDRSPAASPIVAGRLPLEDLFPRNHQHNGGRDGRNGEQLQYSQELTDSDDEAAKVFHRLFHLEEAFYDYP